MLAPASGCRGGLGGGGATSDMSLKTKKNKKKSFKKNCYRTNNNAEKNYLEIHDIALIYFKT